GVWLVVRGDRTPYGQTFKSQRSPFRLRRRSKRTSTSEFVMRKETPVAELQTKTGLGGASGVETKKRPGSTRSRKSRLGGGRAAAKNASQPLQRGGEMGGRVLRSTTERKVTRSRVLVKSLASNSRTASS